MKEGIVRPSRLVNLKSIRGLDELAPPTAGHLTLGALVTLAQIEASADIRRRFPALAEAARHAATPQVRNAATIGGNLLQRPRCWYFRSALFHREAADADAAADQRRESVSRDLRQSKVGDGACVHAGHRARRVWRRSGVDHEDGPDTGGAAEGLSARCPTHRAIATPQSNLVRSSLVSGFPRSRPRRRPPITSRRSARATTGRSVTWPSSCTWIAETVREAAIVMGWVAPTPRRATRSETIAPRASGDRGIGTRRGSSGCCRRDAALEERLQGSDPRGGRAAHDSGGGEDLAA